jgi:hypothetical protein
MDRNMMMLGVGVAIVVIGLYVYFMNTEKFTKLVNMDIGGNDIKCFTDGSSASKCQDLCLKDSNCKGSNYVHPNTVWGKDSGCCYKNKASPLTPIKGIDFYTRK